MGIDPTYAGYRAAAIAARLMPAPALGPVTRLLGVGAASALGGRRALVERNLRRATDGRLTGLALQRAVHQTFESYSRYWLESFRLPGTSAAELDRGLSIDGFEHLEKGLAAGNGVIVALPHLGGWEWAAFWATEVPRMPVSAVVEQVEPPELAEWFVGLRRSLGMEIIMLGPSAGTQVMAALRANRVVCLLCDRDIAGGGPSVDFFGERTTLPGGPATLALRTGATIVPTAVYFEGSGRHAIIRPALPVGRTGRLRDDVARVTQDIADELELLIRRAPEQWHLMQPNWPSDHDWKNVSAPAGAAAGGPTSAPRAERAT